MSTDKSTPVLRSKNAPKEWTASDEAFFKEAKKIVQKGEKLKAAAKAARRTRPTGRTSNAV